MRLGHIGGYPYTWEDAGRERLTLDTFVFHLNPDDSEGDPGR